MKPYRPKFKVGNFNISSDSYQWIVRTVGDLVDVKTRKSSGVIGEKAKANYFTSLDRVAKFIADEKLKELCDKSYEEMEKAMMEFKEQFSIVDFHK